MDYKYFKDLLEAENKGGWFVESLDIVRNIEDIEKEAIFEKRIDKPFSLETKERLADYLLRFWIKEELEYNTIFDITWQAIFEGAWQLENYTDFKERMRELV